MKNKMLEKFNEKFGYKQGVRVFFSPGRVNLIGEHTDYNGGHVFPCALTMGTYAAVRRRDDNKLRFYSANFEKLGVIESSLDELASRFFTNKFYLTRIFKQVTGFTIREYLHIQRVQKAQEFLRSSLLPITEIALMVGFENVSYFEKIFRRYCMQSPREYRVSQKAESH